MTMIRHSRQLHSNPTWLVGKPVIHGTRLSVEFVIGLMADGWSEADILAELSWHRARGYHCMSRRCLRPAEFGEGIPERSRVSMRFLANENFPGAAVAALVAAGHDVVWIRTAAPGIGDPHVLAWAVKEEQRFILTFRQGFRRAGESSAKLPQRAVSSCCARRCQGLATSDSGSPT